MKKLCLFTAMLASALSLQTYAATPPTPPTFDLTVINQATYPANSMLQLYTAKYGPSSTSLDSIEFDASKPGDSINWHAQPKNVSPELHNYGFRVVSITNPSHQYQCVGNGNNILYLSDAKGTAATITIYNQATSDTYICQCTGLACLLNDN